MARITKKIYDGMVVDLPCNCTFKVERGDLVIDTKGKAGVFMDHVFKISDKMEPGYKVIGHSRFGTQSSKRVLMMVLSHKERSMIDVKGNKFFGWYDGVLAQGFTTKKAAHEAAGVGVAIVDREAALNLIFQRMMRR